MILLFEDAWRCYWYHADLITINTGVVTLLSPMNGTSTLKFNSTKKADYTQPVTSGWIRDVLACPFTLGDDVHDLAELFLPKTVVSAENQATFSDYHLNIQGSAPKVHYVMIGYDPLDGPGFRIATRGVFADALPDAEHTETNIFEEKYHGSRLSKN